MSTKKTLLAMSPTSECIVLAARGRTHWTDLAIGGGRRVESVLNESLQDANVGRVILLVYRVGRPAEVRSLLQKLATPQKDVQCFTTTGSTSVERACKGIPHVQLVQGKTLREAVESAGMATTATRGLSDALEAGDKDLHQYLNYKIAMALFGLPNSESLLKATDLLAGLAPGKSSFSLDKDATLDSASVRRFVENDFPYLAGYSQPLKDLKRRVRQVGATDMSVLVLGETGTGKENVATYLHEFSFRRNKPLQVVNCAGLTETFLHSELFGHIRGAYTGADAKKKGAVEVAEGGTLFLDEVGEMPLTVQAALLRFLQNRRYTRLGETAEQQSDVRVIAATQPDLEAKVRDGRFRQDLYYRLAEVTITTPALREVPQDIRFIVDHVLFSLRDRVSKPRFREVQRDFANGTAVLQKHSWPGNVRELRSLVKRKLLLDDDVLSELVQAPQLCASAIPPVPQQVGEIRPIDEILKEYVEAAFRLRGSLTQRQLAERLGRSLNTIKKIRKS